MQFQSGFTVCPFGPHIHHRQPQPDAGEQDGIGKRDGIDRCAGGRGPVENELTAYSLRPVECTLPCAYFFIKHDGIHHTRRSSQPRSDSR